MSAETFATKLEQMRKDLTSIAHRMNRDRSHRLALQAQEAIAAIAELERANAAWFDDLAWDWEPEDE